MSPWPFCWNCLSRSFKPPLNTLPPALPASRPPTNLDRIAQTAALRVGSTAHPTLHPWCGYRPGVLRP